MNALPDQIDPGRFSIDGVAPVFATTARPGHTTEDEALRRCVAWIGEVSLAGVVVHATRTIAHVDIGPAHAERRAREDAAAGFAMTLRQITGYNPDDWRHA